MTNLPANFRDNIAALQEFAQDAATGNELYIKMGRDGVWTHGTDEIEVELDAEWVINPAKLASGFSAFDSEGARVGEEMATVSDGKIIKFDDLDHSVNGSWEKQLGMQVQCLNGADKDLEGLIYMRSKGGINAISAMITEIFSREADGRPFIPVVKLTNSSYKHKVYKKIFTPVFEVQRWLSQDEQGAVQAEDTPAKPARKTRAKQQEPEPETEDVIEGEVVEEETTRPVRRRRR